MFYKFIVYKFEEDEFKYDVFVFRGFNGFLEFICRILECFFYGFLFFSGFFCYKSFFLWGYFLF